MRTQPSVACRAEERKKLERLCRYVARPALALERLGRDGDGLVVHRLKRPFRVSAPRSTWSEWGLQLERIALDVPGHQCLDGLEGLRLR
jgi:hypothetical protein